MTCKDCYQGERKTNHPLTKVEIMNFLFQFGEMGGMVARITGKEPTVHPNLLDFIREGRRLGLKVGLNTNGYFGKKYADELVNAGIQEVVVSIDGDEKSHDAIRKNGSYERALETTKQLVLLGIDTRINMTVCRNNQEQLEHVMTEAAKIGSYVSVIPMRNIGNASKNFTDNLLTSEEMMRVSHRFIELQQKLEPTPKSYIYFNLFSPKPRYYHQFFQMDPCVARKNIFMDCGGDVYPCDHLVSLGKTFNGGNIRSSSLLDIWRNSDGLNRYRQINRNQTCLSCNEFAVRCDGGCSSEHLVSCGGNATEIQRDRLCFKDLLPKTES